LAALWLMRVLGRSQSVDLTRSLGGNGLTSAGHRLVNAALALGAKSNPAHAGLTPHAVAVVAVILAVVALAWWRVDVWFHPIARCRRCGGSGMNRGSRKGARGVCTHGQERPRFGARKSFERHKARRG
jgi:hypothetical protein